MMMMMMKKTSNVCWFIPFFLLRLDSGEMGANFMPVCWIIKALFSLLKMVNDNDIDRRGAKKKPYTRTQIRKGWKAVKILPAYKYTRTPNTYSDTRHIYSSVRSLLSLVIFHFIYWTNGCRRKNIGSLFCAVFGLKDYEAQGKMKMVAARVMTTADTTELPTMITTTNKQLQNLIEINK